MISTDENYSLFCLNYCITSWCLGNIFTEDEGQTHRSQIAKKIVPFCLIIHSLINLIFNYSSRGNINIKPALCAEIQTKNTAKEKNMLTEK